MRLKFTKDNHRVKEAMTTYRRIKRGLNDSELNSLLDTIRDNKDVEVDVISSYLLYVASVVLSGSEESYSYIDSISNDSRFIDYLIDNGGKFL